MVALVPVGPLLTTRLGFTLRRWPRRALNGLSILSPLRSDKRQDVPYIVSYILLADTWLLRSKIFWQKIREEMNRAQSSNLHF
jgi:hypothetical protein